MPPVKTRWARSEIQGQRIHWLLDLTFAGQVVRISGQDLDVTSTELGALSYYGGLDGITYTEAMTLFQQGIEPTTAELDCYMPPDINVPLLVTRGHDLAAATATLSQWVEGTTYEARRVVIVGRVRDPSYGAPEDAVSFAVEQALVDDHGAIPDPAAVVSEDTWSTAAPYLSSADKGLPYPLIFGYPGKTSLALSGWVTGSSCLWVDKRGFNHKLMVAGHGVDATNLYINHDNDTGGQLVNLTTTTDDAGRVVTIVDYNAEGYDYGQANDLGAASGTGYDYYPSTDEDVEIFAGWPNGGGMVGADGTVIRGAGDVLEVVLGYSSLTVDRPAWAAAAPLLNVYRFDCAIDAACVPWEWVSTHALPLLPLTIATGPNGAYPIVWRFWATADDAVAHIDADTDETIDVADRIEVDGGLIRNSFLLDYGLSRRTGEYQSTAALDAEDVASAARATQYLVRAGATLVRIRVYAETAGSAGEGIKVTATAVGGAGVTVTDSASTYSVQIDFQDGVATTADIVTAINATSNLITAVDNDGTEIWTNLSDQSVNLVLLDQGVRASPYCERSQARYASEADGGVYVEQLQSAILYDQGTAEAVLDWRARAFCFAHRRVTLIAPADEYGWLALGDIVLVSYDRLALDEQVAMVEAIEWQDDAMVGLRLLLVDDPVRDIRDA
jgi:hypothetical protein